MLNKFKKNNNKGFTLVELLVVIAIIGVLAVVAVPTLFNQIDKGRVADIHSNVSSVKSAAMAYYADNGEFPTLGGTADKDLVEKGYLDTKPNKDGMAYVVKTESTTTGTAPNTTTTTACVLEITGIKVNKEAEVIAKLNETYGAGSVTKTTKPLTLKVTLIK